MQENFEILQSEDVVAFNYDDSQKIAITAILQAINASYLFGVDDFIDSLINPLQMRNDEAKIILKQGISCRVMTTRKNGWVQGKVKLGLHFVADEIDNSNNEQESPVRFESPLDEIRNAVDKRIAE
jgi:hypothetical protein